jgi:hypothetical protein
MVKSNTDGDAIFDSIDCLGPTKYQVSDTGNNSLISAARPAAAKSDIMNFLFSSKGKLNYADYVLHASSWSSN